MARKDKIIIKMKSEESNSWFTLEKPKKYKEKKLRLRRFCNILRRHVWFNETKLSK